MDARRTPKPVGGRHVADQSAKVLIDGSPTGAVATRASRPAPTEPIAMPAEDRLRLDEDQGRLPASPSVGEQDPEHSVRPAETRPLHLALQGSQLVTQRKILKDKFSTASARDADRPDNQ